MRVPAGGGRDRLRAGAGPDHAGDRDRDGCAGRHRGGYRSPQGIHQLDGTGQPVPGGSEIPAVRVDPGDRDRGERQAGEPDGAQPAGPGGPVPPAGDGGSRFNWRVPALQGDPAGIRTPRPDPLAGILGGCHGQRHARSTAGRHALVVDGHPVRLGVVHPHSRRQPDTAGHPDPVADLGRKGEFRAGLHAGAGEDRGECSIGFIYIPVGIEVSEGVLTEAQSEI